VQSSSPNITTYKPTVNFLQAGYPSCHPTNSVKALEMLKLDWMKASHVTDNINTDYLFHTPTSHFHRSKMHFEPVRNKTNIDS